MEGSRRTSTSAGRRFVATSDTYAEGAASAVAVKNRVGRSYTLFVSCLKMVLPGVAILLLALAIMWPSLSRTGSAIVANVREQIRVTPEQLRNFEMESPTYVGTDEKDRPFKLKAKLARQASAKADKVTLVQPKANLTTGSGNFVAVSAKSGAYRKATQILRLIGDVNVYHDDNYTFKTEEATVDLKKKTAWGDKPVVATGPQAKIRARGFRVWDGGQTVLFLGKSKVVLMIDDSELNEVFGPAAGKSKAAPSKSSPAGR